MTTMTRRHLADLAGALGAGVLGIGLGLLLPTMITRYALPILLLGLLLHSWGMYDTQRLDREQDTPWWAALLTGICWVLLAIGGLVILHHLWMG
ncbi:MAG TPA: hypothetical protein VGE07_02250 [Herpetosiphonaceae bacterium]